MSEAAGLRNASYAPWASSPKTDERYAEALGYVQSGKGHKALELLAQLAEAYPDDKDLAAVIEDVSLRAKLDAHTHVRGRRSSKRLGRAFLYVLISLAIVSLATLGVRSIRVQIAPLVAKAQAEHTLEQLLTEGQAFLQAGEYDDAQARFESVLALAPEDPLALAGLADVTKQREVAALYEQAVALQEAGDYDSALSTLMDLSLLAPKYRDVQLRITQVTQSQNMDQLYAEAEAAFAEGQDELALSQYEELGRLDSKYRSEQIAARLFDAHMRLGYTLLAQTPPRAENVQTALNHFTAALRLQPRSAEASQEQQLAALYVEGQRLYTEGYWDAAASRLRTVYDQRSDYMGMTVVDMLYDAYIRSGDAHDAAQDLPFAYEQYRRAAALPVADTTLAQGRLGAMALRLTPTVTPTVTPTSTPTPLPTQTPLPTALPTPRPLAMYHNRIVFLSDTEDDTSLWSLDPSTGKRAYLGNSKGLLKEYTALIDKYTYSPDGRYHAYVTDASQSTQIFSTRPPDALGNPLDPLQLTYLRVCYQPSWSPDGNRIVFVSEQDQSDDIWVVNVDGTESHNLTENLWPWDKFPSWSPDGKRIVFWSNREGPKQLFIMDANGQNVQNVSKSKTNDYDPVWVR
jgi:TolB protein